MMGYRKNFDRVQKETPFMRKAAMYLLFD